MQYQSWWPDGQYTAPTDEALAFDVKALATFGMNMVRLHQKINPDRWYFHADREGVVVLQDAVQHFNYHFDESVSSHLSKGRVSDAS
jgi:beta-galactosidase/beta-glucuronidase